MPRKHKKRKTIQPPVELQIPIQESAPQGTSENLSNSQKAILSLPVELRDEILNYYPKITFFTEIPAFGNVLSRNYQTRRNVLRALSQLCVAYRRVFFPMLWESLDICFRTGETKKSYMDLGKVLERHCDGISSNPAIRPYVRTFNLVLLRYNSGVTLPKLRALLSSLQNLHTIHLLHTNFYKMDKPVKDLFRDGLVLPNIRTLLIEGHSQDFLKCCPNVVNVWCIQDTDWSRDRSRDSGSKLVSVMKEHCKNIEVMRGFGDDERLIRKIVIAVPNLHEFEVQDSEYEPFLKHVDSFNKFNTLIIRTFSHSGVQECISAFKQKFRTLPFAGVKRRIRLLHASPNKRMGPASKGLASDRCEGNYTEVDMD